MSKLEKRFNIDGVEVELEAEYEYFSIYRSWDSERMYIVSDSGRVLGQVLAHFVEGKLYYEEVK